MRHLVPLVLLNWFIVFSTPSVPYIYRGTFTDKAQCEKTVQQWQAEEPQPMITWECLAAADYNLVATPKTPTRTEPEGSAPRERRRGPGGP
jgi:hypothetical protein